MVKDIIIPIYDKGLSIVIIENNEDREMINRKYGVELSGGPASTIYKKDNGRLNMGIVFRDVDSANDAQIVAHECFHLTSILLRHIGATLTDESEEAFAYLLGYLVDEVNKNVVKMIKSNTAKQIKSIESTIKEIKNTNLTDVAPEIKPVKKSKSK